MLLPIILVAALPVVILFAGSSLENFVNSNPEKINVPQKS